MVSLTDLLSLYTPIPECPLGPPTKPAWYRGNDPWGIAVDPDSPGACQGAGDFMYSKNMQEQGNTFRTWVTLTSLERRILASSTGRVRSLE